MDNNKKITNDITIFEPENIISISQPKSYKVNFDSIENIKYNITVEWSRKGKKYLDPQIPNFKPNINEVIIDSSALKIVTIGKDVPWPKLYKIPQSGYKVQYGDTIYAPEKIKIKQPKSNSALPMKAMPNRVKDIKYINVESGLSNSNFRYAIQDSKGYMWFASTGKGLIRYNGTSYWKYNTNNGLGGDYVNCLMEDRNENIWIGTKYLNGIYESGITKYDGDYFVNFNDKQGFTNFPIRSIYQDSTGNIWFATEGDGVFVYKEVNGLGRVINYTKENGLPSNEVFAFCENKDGSMLIGTNNGLCEFTGSSFISYVEEGNAIKSILKDGYDNIWYSNKTSIYKDNGNSVLRYSQKDCLKDISQIVIDDQGILWAANWHSGLAYFNGQNFGRITDKDGLRDMRVPNVFKDKTGNIWASTYGGIHKLKINSFFNYPLLAGMSNKFINGFSLDKSKNLWMGSRVIDGIIKYDYKYFQHHYVNSARSSFTYVDKDDNLWFGSKKKDKFQLNKYDGSFLKRYHLHEFKNSNKVTSVVQDHDNSIWIGTLEGLFRYDGKRILKFDKENGVPNKITKLDIDKKGNLWICSENGLGKFDGKNFLLYTEDHGLRSDFLRNFIIDKQGNIILSSVKGLSMLTLDAEKSVLLESYNYGKSNDLDNEYIYTLLEDDNYNLWVGSQNGVNKLSPTGTKGTFTNVNLTREDGFLEDGGIINSVVLDDRNTIWWSSRKGLVRLDLSNYEFVDTKPSIKLNDISINQQSIDFRRLEDSSYTNKFNFKDDLKKLVGEVEPFENYPKTLKLPYNLNHIKFTFSSMDWRYPESMQYQYILKGNDKKWSELNKDNFAEYRNIDHGRYTFKVRACGKTGICSETFNYKFRITPPWWKRYWVKILFTLIGLFLIYRIIKYRVAIVRKGYQEKEEFWAITEKQNRVFKDFSFITSHNIRIAASNLIGLHNLIKNDVDTQLMQMLDTSDAKLLNSIEHVNQLLNTNNYGSNNTFKEEVCSVKLAVEYAISKNKELKKLKNASISINIPNDWKVLTIQNYLNNILYELIKNALIFGITDENKNIDVFVKTLDSAKIIVIQDYGLGLEENDKNKVFDIGSRCHSEKSEGEGLGLYVVKSQIDRLGWDIELKSEINKGTTFSIICNG